jgi:hypothetical protein
MSKSPPPITDPDAPVKLDGSSKSSFAAAIRALAPGRRGWISMKEPAGLFPGDVLLAQKIALETMERKVLALANRQPFRA